MTIALIITGCAFAYICIAAFVAGVASRYPDVFDGEDGPPPFVIGIFWPFAIPITGLVLAGMKCYRLGRAPAKKLTDPFYRLGRGKGMEEKEE
jgi:hypothetical protein